MTKLKIYCDKEGFVDCEQIAYACNKVLKQKVKTYVDLAIVSEKEIQTLNKENRNVDSVTDVLSFPMLDAIRGKVLKTSDYPDDFDLDERAIFMGSIAICEERAKEQAKEFGHSEKREFTYLLVHGVLHLFGYDHMNEEDKKQMREKEEEIMNLLGVSRDV